MTSHIEIYRETLQQFDRESEAIEAEIDRLRLQQLRNRDARLQYQRMMEKVFGAPEQTVVMQDMRLAGRRAEEPARVAYQPPPMALSETEIAAKAGHKRQRDRQRDHEAYQRRMARETPEEREWRMAHDRERARLKRAAGGARPRLIGRKAAVKEQVRQIFAGHPEKPLRTSEVRDRLFPTRVTSKREMQGVYQALHELKKAGVLRQDHPGASYVLANGAMQG